MAKQRSTSEITFQEAFDGVKKFPWPFCEVCQEDIDEMRLVYDADKEAHFFEARCHREIKTICTVTDHLLKEIEKGRLDPGVAFKAKKSVDE